MKSEAASFFPLLRKREPVFLSKISICVNLVPKIEKNPLSKSEKMNIFSLFGKRRWF
jgi:hypothetical protein